MALAKHHEDINELRSINRFLSGEGDNRPAGMPYSTELAAWLHFKDLPRAVISPRAIAHCPTRALTPEAPATAPGLEGEDSADIKHQALENRTRVARERLGEAVRDVRMIIDVIDGEIAPRLWSLVLHVQAQLEQERLIGKSLLDDIQITAKGMAAHVESAWEATVDARRSIARTLVGEDVLRESLIQMAIDSTIPLGVSEASKARALRIRRNFHDLRHHDATATRFEARLVEARSDIAKAQAVFKAASLYRGRAGYAKLVRLK